MQIIKKFNKKFKKALVKFQKIIYNLKNHINITFRLHTYKKYVKRVYKKVT